MDSERALSLSAVCARAPAAPLYIAAAARAAAAADGAAPLRERAVGTLSRSSRQRDTHARAFANPAFMQMNANKQANTA